MPQGTRGRPSLTAEHLTSGELQRRDSVTLDAEAVDLGSDYSESPRRQMTEGFTNFSYGVLLPGPVMDNKGILSDEEFGLATVLQEAGQGHLMAQWPMPGTDDDLKRKLLQQAKHLHETSPGEGGIIGYASRARKLLADSAEGVNPLDGWSPSVPEGVALEPGSARYAELEEKGAGEVGACGFVLVAGGLGERLGYGDIKLKLPTELCTETSYLALYCAQIQALQARYGEGQLLPLAIMVSDDTEDKTSAELEAHQHFGLDPKQVTLIKQEKVPAIQDNDGRFVLEDGDKYQISTKPHGHGDVHTLMHRCGVARRWHEDGVRWCVFMQDTNGLALHSLAAALGVSVELELEVNSMAIPRKAKQAVGGIARLTREDGSAMTVNVEYNQLDPLLRGSGHKDGDTNDPDTGFSPYPGNINQLLFAMGPYCDVLEKTGGALEEFVNPKYADDSRTTFKKPTRLECMMQDYPKLLPPEAKVGFTSMAPWLCFSPVKNSLGDAQAAQAKGTPPASASSGEADQYHLWAELLRTLGCAVESGPIQEYEGIGVSLSPRIVVQPGIAVTLHELKSVVPSPADVKISADSTLLVLGAGTVVIDKLDLDGTLILQAAAGETLHVKRLTVRNSGWHCQALTAEERDSAAETLRMRGYRLAKGEQCEASGAKVIDRLDTVSTGAL